MSGCSGCGLHDVLSDLSAARVCPRTEDDPISSCILGGIYSSTATTVVLAKRQRDAGIARSELVAGILAATAMMYLRLGAVVALFNFNFCLGPRQCWQVSFAMGTILAIYEWRRTAEQPDTDLQISAINPLQIATAITFGTIFVATSVVTWFIDTMFGQTGASVLAGLAGITGSIHS